MASTLSNGKVAVLVCGVASVVSGAWMSWGWGMHTQRMSSANKYERELAKRVDW